MASMISMPDSKFFEKFPFLTSKLLPFSFHRDRFEEVVKRFRLQESFSFYSDNKSVVSVEQELAQVTPSSSPEKVYSSLKVATPHLLKPTGVGDSHVDPSLRIVEEVTIGTTPPPALPSSSGETHDLSEPPKVHLPSRTSPVATGSSAIAKTMETSLADFAQDLFWDFESS